MAIRKVPSDTETFRFFNANPFNKKTGDCVYRAVSVVAGISWNEAVRGMAETAIKTGWSPASRECCGEFLKEFGFQKMKQPRKPDGKKYTGADLCKWLTTHDQEGCVGAVFISIGGHHVACIAPTIEGVRKKKIAYKICDIWNSTGKCVGNIWIQCNPSLLDSLYQNDRKKVRP